MLKPHRLFAAAAIAAAALSSCKKPPPPAPPPPEVIVETLRRGDLPVTLFYPGRVAGTRVVEVRAQINGRIVQRAYKEGDTVKAGDLLFQIDPAPYRNAYDLAAAQVAQQRAAIASANAEYLRAKSLVEDGAVSRREFEQAEAANQQAQAGLAAAEAAARSARLDLDYTSVRAPVSGRASKEAVTVGNLVNGGASRAAGGDLLTSIIQSDPAYVEASVPEPEFLKFRDAAAVNPDGLMVHISSGSSCKTVGKVDFTDAYVNSSTGTIRARAIFPNPDGCLLSGQYVGITVQGLTLPNTVALPKTAVLFSQMGPLTWVVDANDVVQPRPVQLQESFQDSWIVAKGLDGGERVIVEGLLKVMPGVKVRPLTREEAARREQAALQPQGQKPQTRL